MRPTKVTRGQILDSWKARTGAFRNSRGMIALCRDVRRGTLTVTPDPSWVQANRAAAATCLSVLPERWEIEDAWIAQIGGGDRGPYFTRTPLSGTDQGQDDADQFEIWANALAAKIIPREAIVVSTVQAAQDAVIVVPSTEAMLACPEYEEEVEEDGTKRKQPKRKYDRDRYGKPTLDKGKRDEGKSKDAWSKEYLGWLASHPPVAVRLVHPLDCVPDLVPSYGARPYACNGLTIRTLYDVDRLVELGFNWQGMEDADKGRSRSNKGRGPMLLPRAWGSEQESAWGHDGQVYLYERWTMLPGTDGRPHVVCAYTVGGAGTWSGDLTADADPAESAYVIDFTEQYGIREPLWDYFQAFHGADDPDWMSPPMLWRYVQLILGIEEVETSIAVATRENAYTGYVIKPDASLGKESFMHRITGMLRRFKKPAPGEAEVMPGDVKPFSAAQVGADAWRMAEMRKSALAMHAPNPALSGSGEGDPSGHSLVVGTKLSERTKRQARRSILDRYEFILSRAIMICLALMHELPGSEAAKDDPGLPPIPVWKREEDVLDDGTVESHSDTLQLNPRWVGRDYHLDAHWPEESNPLAVAQAMDKADRGYGTDEDVFEAEGKRSVTAERIKIAVFRSMRTPEGQAELDLRAAKYRGDKERAQRLELVLAQKASPGGSPLAALGAPPQQMGLPPGNPGLSPASNAPDPANAALDAVVGGAMGASAQANDARALAQIGGG